MALSLPMLGSPTPAPSPLSHQSSGCRLVTTDGRELPLRGVSLRVEASGGIARVVLEQRFGNPYAEPLSVTYQMPLPADAAVSGYAFTVGKHRIEGEVDRKHAARERFEQAVALGHTAALLEQERSSLFTQEVGNIPPGAELVAEISLDQRLVFLPEGSWEWRFPTVVGPRYLGAEGRVSDAAKITVGVADRPQGARARLSLRIGDAISAGKHPESPSHPLSSEVSFEGAQVTLADGEGARLDRDVVVRWPVSAPEVGLSLATARPSPKSPNAHSAYGLLTIVPPSPERQGEPVARDLIVLIDTSGSMGGRPLEQAARVVSALIDGLSDRDRIELIEFNNAPRRWQRAPAQATPKAKKEAIAWVRALRAGGGTEMRDGIVEALRPLRAGSQRQVILITDGYIGFEREIVETLHDRLPRGSRLHALGVGSSVNRSLTGPAARAGRGVEVIVGLDEDPERGAQRMVERTFAPLVTDVVIDGDALVAQAPAAMPDLFARSPVLASLRLRPEGGKLRVRGQTARGEWKAEIAVPPVPASSGNQAVTALFGRETVEDLETRWAMGDDAPRIDAEIERIGLAFQIATRLTSWVAISKEVMVDPEARKRHEDIAQELPYGTTMEGFGLRQAQGASGGEQEDGVLFSLKELASFEDDEEEAGSDVRTRAGMVYGKKQAPKPSLLKEKLSARVSEAAPPRPGSPAPLGAARPAAPAFAPQSATTGAFPVAAPQGAPAPSVGSPVYAHPSAHVGAPKSRRPAWLTLIIVLVLVVLSLIAAYFLFGRRPARASVELVPAGNTMAALHHHGGHGGPSARL